MKKLIVIALICLLFAENLASAETIDLTGLAFEVPAGFTQTANAEYADVDQRVMITASVQDPDGKNLETFLEETAVQPDWETVLVDPNKTVNNIPFGMIVLKGEDGFKRIAVFMGTESAYLISYETKGEFTDADGMAWTNILSSVTAENIVGGLNYTIISTNEYARAEGLGMVYRVYTPDGQVDADTAVKIFWDIVDQDFTYDLHTVFFYDMESAADGSGMAYGQVAQDDYATVPEFEPFSY